MQWCEHSGVLAEAPAILRGIGVACVVLLSPGDACSGVSLVVFLRKLELECVVSVLHVWCYYRPVAIFTMNMSQWDTRVRNKSAKGVAR